MNHLASLSIAFLVLGAASPIAAAGSAEDVAQGQLLAQVNCASCHALGRSGPSPLPDAPPFRDIATNYAEGELEDSFNDGIVVRHPAMPDWQMTGDQARELAAFVMSLANEP